VVWSTAYLDEAERCDEVLLLNEGSLLFEGPPRELTDRVASRSYLVKHPGTSRRRVLARALERSDVLDGVIQGRSVRLVMRESAATPSSADLGAGETAILERTPPRFEDAFVDALGGGPGGRSVLAEAVAARKPSGKEQPAVEARGLTKRFGRFTAAQDITFSIPPGVIFGLLGPNGAGKSTTFRMMCGLLRPTEGKGLVAGHDLRGAASKARERLGYMAQKFSLYGNLSVRQNLSFFAGVYGLSGKRRSRAVERMVDIFDLGPYLDQSAGDLPLGFKQRLALSCALMHDPAILFLDEPTSGVDPITRREFWTHINGLVEKGITVMVTTHFMDEAEYCDRIGLVFRGRLVSVGTPDELKSRAAGPDNPDPALEDAFIQLVQGENGKGRAA
jgi:ABC-type multidrug transport system ATPase subunit